MSYNKKKKLPGKTYQEIVREIEKEQFSTVYFLQGEETYFINELAKYIVANALTEEERAFNLITCFGADVNIERIITSARGFPMTAKRLVIWVKEAQDVKNIELLEHYIAQPQTSTVLILCYANKRLDARKKVSKLLEQNATLYTAELLKEYELQRFVIKYAKKKGIVLQPAAAELLVELIGLSVKKAVSELDKLSIGLPQKNFVVTPEFIKERIGVSKEFSVYEFLDAIGVKDTKKVFTILNYFEKNTNEYPIQRILPSLFNYFRRAFLACYVPQKDVRSIGKELGLHEWQVKKNVMPVMQNYSGVKIMNILSRIRKADAFSKGKDGMRVKSGELLKELVVYILMVG